MAPKEFKKMYRSMAPQKTTITDEQYDRAYDAYVMRDLELLDTIAKEVYNS